MRRLLEGRRLLEAGAYFNVDTEKCGTYYREAIIWGPALIIGNTVFCYVSLCIEKGKFLHFHDVSNICDENVVTDSSFAKFFVTSAYLVRIIILFIERLTSTQVFCQKTVYADWFLIWYVKCCSQKVSNLLLLFFPFTFTEMFGLHN